jgi:hypothetical protein
MAGQHVYSVPVPNPGRAPFDLGYSYKTSTEMGLLVPTLCKTMMPGDVFDVSWTNIVRLMPLTNPVLHNLRIHFDLFFCPFRNLWDSDASATDNWEEFITGGEDGTSTPTFPTWNPATKTVNSLWDKLTFPVGISPTDRYPSAMPARAYSWICNEWYFSTDVDTPITIDLTGGTDTTDYAIQNRRWPHDYFTAMLTSQQRGTAPAMSVSGTAVWDTASFSASAFTTGAGYSNTGSDPIMYINNATAAQNAEDMFNANTLSATSVNIAGLRLATAQQRFLERMNLFGPRYTEYLRGHFGQTIPDSVVQRPVHIGSIVTPIEISEVLQTSETTVGNPLGTLGGHGISMDSNRVGSYRAREWGIIMGITSIMPEADYQQGIDREWLPQTRYDFYAPEFNNLSDQGVEEVELKAAATGSHNTTVLGYIGAWDHLRSSWNKVTGYFRTGSSPDFSMWNLARYFSSRPALNSDFLQMKGTYAGDPYMKRCFTVQDEYSFLIQTHNTIRALRPMSKYASPGGLN